MTSPVFDSREQAGRGLKAGKLVQELDRIGADLDYVAHMGPVEWAVCSHAAGVRHPSDKTKAVVVAVFARRQADAGKSPLDGIGLRG